MKWGDVYERNSIAASFSLITFFPLFFFVPIGNNAAVGGSYTIAKNLKEQT